jgi:hypothetical protein
MGSAHECVEKDGFELMLVAYPNAVWRCKLCNGVMRMSPLDDLSSDDLEFAMEVIQRYRRAHGKA